MTRIQPETERPQQNSCDRQPLNDEKLKRAHCASGQRTEHKNRQHQSKNSFFAVTVQPLADHTTMRLLDCNADLRNEACKASSRTD